MKKFKILAVLMACTMLFSACSLGKNNKNNDTQEEKKTVTFTDSAGRKVEVPETINRIAPSGPLAQIFLYTACPEKLVGISSEYSDTLKEYIDEKYWSLPVFGKFYGGKSANLNMEEVIKAKPDIIIDVGQKKDTIVEDMDSIQEAMNIPTVFIESTTETMGQSYEKMQELLGKSESLQKMGNYCDEIIKKALKFNDETPDEEKVNIYFAGGENGLNTNAEGSYHSQTLEMIGVDNVAKIDVSTLGAGSEVSMEQLLTWNPEVIITETQSVYDIVTTDETWKDIDAVKNGKVYLTPIIPYNFLSNPPSVNKILGISWFGHLLYPDYYEFNNDIMKDFYHDFYHIDITEEQINEIMVHAK